MPNCICQKCRRSLREIEFYTHKDGTKMTTCKKCTTMFIDNFDPETFLWILEELDLPYVEGEWNVLRDRAFAKDPTKMTGMSVIGKYISKMKLKQWRVYGWADTEELAAKIEKEKETAEQERKHLEEELSAKLETGEISESQYKTLVSTTEQNSKLEAAMAAQAAYNNLDEEDKRLNKNNPYKLENFISDEEANEDDFLELTKEDRLYLASKWGRLYRQSEWIALEKDYHNMTNSFDIQDADTINTLIMLCKTNLKANQALDVGDIDGFQRLARVASDLRKTAKFTAAQNKEQKDDFVDCVGLMVSYCEKNGGRIPKHNIETDYDVIDTIIKDQKSYLRELVYADPSLGQQIEDYLKARAIADEKIRRKQLAKLENKTLEEIEQEEAVNEADVTEHYERILTEVKKDEDTYYNSEYNEFEEEDDF